MQRICFVSILIIFLLLSSTSCKKETIQDTIEPDETEEIKNKSKTYDIVIIYGGTTPRDSFDIIVESFKETITRSIEKQNDKVNIHLFYPYMTDERVETKEDKLPGITEKIKTINPALICSLNGPQATVDKKFSKPLENLYKFISLNPIPARSEIIESWEKPGGNIAGVGVFIQLTSPIRLAKKLDPSINKVVSYSWDVAGLLNDWWEAELTRACEEENLKMVEFRRIKTVEDEIKVYDDYNIKDGGYLLIPCISPRINSKGEGVGFEARWKYLREKINHLLLLTYDETTVSKSCIAGTTVIWDDIGRQLADLGIRIIHGENPGDIPWEYPRKYNIVLNLQRAKEQGIEIPQEVINAAYKVYTDYEGNFVGQK